MLQIPLLSNFFASTKKYYLDDFVDQLHGVFTTSVLLLCAMFIGSKQYFGEPIQCMLPAHMERSTWSAYSQYYCFVESTYRLTYNKTVPNATERSRVKEAPGVFVNYYMWVPYFLCFQAVFFWIPVWFRRFFQAYSYVDMEVVVGEALSLRSPLSRDERDAKVKKIAEFIHDSLEFSSRMEKMSKWYHKLFPNIYSFYSTCIYVCSKLLYLLNDLLQLYLIGKFVGIDDLAGLLQPHLLAVSLFSSNNSFKSHYFPRVTFCDIRLQKLAFVETNTLQCIIMLNVFNEKLFCILWYWVFFLALLSFFQLLVIGIRSLKSAHGTGRINHYILEGDIESTIPFLKSSQKHIRLFVNEYLKPDGVLLIQFIHNSVGAMAARDIIVKLWHFYCDLSLASASRSDDSAPEPFVSYSPSEDPYLPGLKMRMKANAAGINGVQFSLIGGQ